MKKKEIRSVVRMHIKSIWHAFKKTRRRFDQNEIHLYRVEIKKFGAFLELIGWEKSGRHQVKIPIKMRALYKAIGLVRTLKIEENKIIEFSDPGSDSSPYQYLHLIAGRVKQAKALAKETVNKKNPFKRGNRRLLYRLPESLSKSHIKKFISTEKNSLNKLIGVAIPGDQSMHSIRKILKTLLYTQKFTQTETVSLLKGMPLSGRDQMATLTEIIGRFQDLTTSLNLLKEDFLKESIADSEETALRSMEVQWTLQKETARSDIYKILNAGKAAKNDLGRRLISWQH